MQAGRVRRRHKTSIQCNPHRDLECTVIVKSLFAGLIPIIGLLTGCSGPDLVNALTSYVGYKVVADIRYGNEPRQRLDLYVPDGVNAGTPVIVFFYGGGWESGRRQDYRFVGAAFARRGYVVAIPDYRLYPEVRYPAFLKDAAAALVQAQSAGASATGSSIGKVYLVGHSAGAYNAVMLTLDNRWLKAHGMAPCRTIAATVGLAGPYDFLPLESRTLKAIFGPEPTSPDTQPIYHAGQVAPPLLLITGANDVTVTPRNTTALADAVNEKGGTAEARVYPDLGHVALAASLAPPFEGLAPTLDDIDGFLRRFQQTNACRAPT